MRKLNYILPTTDVPDWLKIIFDRIKNWANSLSGITYDMLSLNTGDIPPGKVDWPEWFIDFLPFVVATTSINYTICSSVFQWDPLKYPTTGGTWYFEASLAIANAAQTVSCHLMGASEVTGSAVTHTGDTGLAPKRSVALTMPTSAANLYAEFKTSSASVQATFAGARLIFVPS